MGYNYLNNIGLEINELKPTNIMINENEIIKVRQYSIKNSYQIMV